MEPSVTERVVEVDNIQVECKIMEYTDRFFIIISEVGRIGTLVEGFAAEGFEVVIDTKVLFGDRSKEGVRIFARALYEKLYPRVKKPVLFGLGFKDESPSHLMNIKNMFLTNFTF